REPQIADRGVRTVAAASENGLHRSVLDARLGSPHADRRDDARARRSRAQRHGATPVTAIQISYSLVERTVEGDLMPMAREFGLGVTPWSPLAGGVLSGKYTRGNAATADRGERVTSALTE